jgi:hypothetical protein
MLLIGFAMMVFGGMFPGLTFFVLTTVIVGTALLSFLFNFLIPYYAPGWLVWIAFYFCFGLGAGMGVGASKWPHLGILIMGATVGFVSGKIIDVLII